MVYCAKRLLNEVPAWLLFSTTVILPLPVAVIKQLCKLSGQSKGTTCEREQAAPLCAEGVQEWSAGMELRLLGSELSFCSLMKDLTSSPPPCSERKFFSWLQQFAIFPAGFWESWQRNYRWQLHDCGALSNQWKTNGRCIRTESKTPFPSNHNCWRTGCKSRTTCMHMNTHSLIELVLKHHWVNSAFQTQRNKKWDSPSKQEILACRTIFRVHFLNSNLVACLHSFIKLVRIQ